MRIAIAVHGRFHAFDLAAALLKEGVDVQLLTNYPRSVVRRWFPPERTRSLLLQGMVTRVTDRITGGDHPEFFEAAVKRYFGRWAARRHARLQPDIAHCWSGVAEETLRVRPAARCGITRGSAHIAAQKQLLVEEQARVGVPLDQPTAWIIHREEREYRLADCIIVPSTFARETFVARGFPCEKVKTVPLALQPVGFTPTAQMIRARLQRLRSGAPLRVLYAGAISYRKGMHDISEVLSALSQSATFRLVGPLLPECKQFARRAATQAAIEPPVKQRDLPEVYAWGDVFLFPTIEDGFGVVLAQAQAAGLPILTTPNCGGPDILAAGGQGWVVPIRSPDHIIAQLNWCNENRGELADMVEMLHARPPRRTWTDVARDFIEAVKC